MKNKIWFTLNLLLLLAILGFQSIHASPIVQTGGLASGMFGVAPTYSLATCEANYLVGLTTYCPTGTGQLYYCLSTSACSTAAGWVQIGNGSTTAVQKVQGVAPGATGNVSLACTATFAATAAAFTAGTTTQAMVPAGTLPVTCTGSGS
jgi:hypothetical protein